MGRIDDRLAELGAVRLLDRAECEPGDDDALRQFVGPARLMRV